MGIGTWRVDGRLTLGELTSAVVTPWEFRRGINTPVLIAADKVALNNINLVRARHTVTWTPTGVGYRFTPSIDFSEYDTWLATLPSYTKVIIDLHTAPGFHLSTTIWADDVFWYFNDYIDNVLDYWGQTAQHYAGNTRIAGYDILNEPNCPGKKGKTTLYPAIINSAADIPTTDFWNQMITAWTDLGWFSPRLPPSTAPTWSVGDRDPRSWRGSADLIIEAIRAYDKKTPIVYNFASYGGTQPTGTNISQGPFYHRNTSPQLWYDVEDVNPVYAWHFYEPRPWQLRGQGSPPASKAEFEAYLSDIRQYTLSHPTWKVFIGEYGPALASITAPDQQRWMCELWEEYQWTACKHTLTYTSGSGDVSTNPTMLAVLQAFWALNDTG